jgi:hypothetical protein
MDVGEDAVKHAPLDNITAGGGQGRSFFAARDDSTPARNSSSR